MKERRRFEWVTCFEQLQSLKDLKMDTDEQKKFEKDATRLRYGLAGVCLVFALLQVIFPERIDEKTAMFLGLALVVLIADRITKFKAFGIEYEVVRQLKEDVSNVKENVSSVSTALNNLEKEVGPGSKGGLSPSPPPITSGSPPPAAMTSAAARVDAAPSFDETDPNKGQFGGSPDVSGRKLMATIKPDAGRRSARCRVVIKVVSTDSNRPLTGKVRLHLHPTFGRWSNYFVDVKNGVAQDEIVSYGAFTIGAEADEGATRLELDLVDVIGGTEPFYAS